MRRYLGLLAAAILVLAATSANAQNRNVGARTFTMDDGAGHTFTMQAPAGMTGNVTYNMPLPPAGNPPAGFVNVGNAGGQTLYWNSVNSDWEASNIISNLVNGNGSSVNITAPIFSVLGSSFSGNGVGNVLTVSNAGAGDGLTVSNTGTGKALNATGPVAVNGTLNTTSSATVATANGTSNTFGNGTGASNHIGDGSNAQNFIGTLGGGTTNTIGSAATFNTFGLNGGTNSLGNANSGFTSNTTIGSAGAGSTTNVTIGGGAGTSGVTITSGANWSITSGGQMTTVAPTNIFGTNGTSGTILSLRNDNNSAALSSGPVAINAGGNFNALTLNNTGTSANDILGSASTWSISKTGAAAIATLSEAGGKLTADANGNLTKINNVAYSFPASQASTAGRVLSNDGAGNLTWVVTGANSAQVASPNSQYSTSPITTNQNNLAINSTSTYFKVNSTANVNITGIDASTSQDGRVVYFSNVGNGGFSVTFNNLNGSSSAANQFLMPGGFDVSIGNNSTAVFIYDATAQKWRLVSNN